MVITAIGFGRSLPAAISAAASRTTSLRQGYCASDRRAEDETFSNLDSLSGVGPTFRT